MLDLHTKGRYNIFISALMCLIVNRSCKLWSVGNFYFFMSDFNFLIPLLAASILLTFSCLQYAFSISSLSLSSLTWIGVPFGLSVGLPVLGLTLYHLTFEAHNCIITIEAQKSIVRIPNIFRTFLGFNRIVARCAVQSQAENGKFLLKKGAEISAA